MCSSVEDIGMEAKSSSIGNSAPTGLEVLRFFFFGGNAMEIHCHWGKEAGIDHSGGFRDESMLVFDFSFYPYMKTLSSFAPSNHP